MNIVVSLKNTRDELNCNETNRNQVNKDCLITWFRNINVRIKKDVFKETLIFDSYLILNHIWLLL